MQVGETDHSSYAILYYQKGQSISVKLYGGSAPGGLWQMKDGGSSRVGNLCWALGLPARAPEDPDIGMGSPHGAGAQMESFVLKSCKGGRSGNQLSELKEPLARSFAMGGTGSFGARTGRA